MNHIPGIGGELAYALYICQKTPGYLGWEPAMETGQMSRRDYLLNIKAPAPSPLSTNPSSAFST